MQATVTCGTRSVQTTPAQGQDEAVQTDPEPKLIMPEHTVVTSMVELPCGHGVLHLLENRGQVICEMCGCIYSEENFDKELWITERLVLRLKI